MQCLGKTKYVTKKSAKRAARLHGKRVYRCKECRLYHLTSKSLIGAGQIDYRPRNDEDEPRKD